MERQNARVGTFEYTLHTRRWSKTERLISVPSDICLRILSPAERLVEDKHLIVLLNNTGGTKLGEMSQKIRKILYSEPHKEPQRPISQLLYKTILEGGVGAALNQYRELKANQPEVYDFGEFELEFVGRHL